jgi:hypothetical protein
MIDGVAERHAVGGPQRCPRGVHPLGVDIVGTVAGVVPADDRAPRAVPDDRGYGLLVRGGAQGAAIRGPRAVHGPRGQHALGVDVPVGTVAGVIPGDDGTSRAVRDARGRQLIVGRGAERHAVGGPRAIHRPRAQHVLRVDVVFSAAAVVVPGDDRAPRAVRDNRGPELIAGGGAQCHTVGGPLRCPRGVHPLGVDVRGAGGAAVVVPGDDRAPGAVRDDRGGALSMDLGAERDAVGGPLRRPCGVHALGIDVIAGAAADVDPGDDRAPRTVRCDRGVTLISRGGAERYAVGGPLRRPRGVQPLRVDVEVAAAVVVPGDDRTPRAVRYARGSVLVPGGGAEGNIHRWIDRAIGQRRAGSDGREEQHGAKRGDEQTSPPRAVWVYRRAGDSSSAESDRDVTRRVTRHDERSPSTESYCGTSRSIGDGAARPETPETLWIVSHSRIDSKLIRMRPTGSREHYFSRFAYLYDNTHGSWLGVTEAVRWRLKQTKGGADCSAPPGAASLGLAG